MAYSFETTTTKGVNSYDKGKISKNVRLGHFFVIRMDEK